MADIEKNIPDAQADDALFEALGKNKKKKQQAQQKQEHISDAASIEAYIPKTVDEFNVKSSNRE